MPENMDVMESVQPSPLTGDPQPDEGEIVRTVRSLKELIERATGSPETPENESDSGLADMVPFPFLGIVGQREMKLALILALINPHLGGVLLIGPRGTGKTTAVRSLVDLLPFTPRSRCRYGCMPEDIEGGGMDAVCPDCARKYGEGQPLTVLDQVRLVELPLNATLDDVLGRPEDSGGDQERPRLRQGLLAQADQNLLYVDEINLLPAEIADAILDAAAQGSYHVRRAPVSGVFRSRFVLVGSMNPEEGNLRPQILDRFSLKVVVRGLVDPAERLEAYRRAQAYQENPRLLAARYQEETRVAREEIQAARDLLPEVTVPDRAAQQAIGLIQRLGIDSLRAEQSWLGAARALAAADGRREVSPEDLIETAAFALCLRRSSFMSDFLQRQSAEEDEIHSAAGEVFS